MLPTISDEIFELPPVTRTSTGAERRVGVELEYAGVGLEQSAEILRQCFGGELVQLSPFQYTLQQSELGEFGIEIDTSILKDKKYEAALEAVGVKLSDEAKERVESALLGAFSTFVPFEISTPPIPLSRLGTVDLLREQLRLAGAKGTHQSVLYAFGLHLNVELPELLLEDIRRTLTAFVVLYPWIEERVQVDFTRWICPYINRFPADFVRRLIRREGNEDDFIAQYLEANPTRNRPLDLLPVLSSIDRPFVVERIESPNLTKPRPAYHYRMPNCLIDEPQWRISREWNTWVQVERVASDRRLLAELVEKFLEEGDLAPVLLPPEADLGAERAVPAPAETV